jgi:hypothetical protein
MCVLYPSVDLGVYRGFFALFDRGYRSVQFVVADHHVTARLSRNVHYED